MAPQLTPDQIAQVSNNAATPNSEMGETKRNRSSRAIGRMPPELLDTRKRQPKVAHC
jgi:hypothetical protein